jgi:hypothetical protein
MLQLQHGVVLQLHNMSDFTSNTGEGRCPNDGTGSDSWATIRGAASCSTGVDATGLILSNVSGSTFRVHRFFMPFDTTTIPASATINSVSLKFYRDDGVTAFYNNDSTSVHVVVQNQSSNTSLATSDFGTVNFTSKGSVTYASTSNGAYSTITISDTSVVTKAGHTKLALITGLDQGNSQPTGTNNIGFQNRSQANPPTLVVSYSTPSGNFMAFFN